MWLGVSVLTFQYLVLGFLFGGIRFDVRCSGF